ncbi:MAG: hypothetical protein LBL69_07140, partial [Zoogloeaceae bacterium]|nr:hypothetical protein [Zoogloeaceae bacterium]
QTEGFHKRTIWTDKEGARVGFDADQIADADTRFAAHQCDPNVAPGSRETCLSQFAGNTLSPELKAAASTSTLIDWLKGDPTWAKTLYRERTTPLGDIVHATPVFLPGSPNLVLAAANDGMLHAFNADSGKEEWAWIPSVLLPDLWRLADKNYPARHRFYLDGPQKVVEADGKTRLIGAFGAGAKGYYALDLSDRLKPELLWNFDDAQAGHAFNAAKVAQVGTQWVALLPSGVNAADGKARLFMVDLASGTTSKTFEPAASDGENGLSAIALYQPDGPAKAARWAFGGDLQGNLWRFDLASGDSVRIAELKGPVTAEPVVSLENGEVVLYVGTGQYLGKPDLLDDSQQYIYGIKTGIARNGEALAEVDKPFVPDLTLSISGTSITGKADWNWASGTGFVLSLPAKARVWQKAELAYGLLAILSVTPENAACVAGGKSTLYLINTKTGQGELRQFDKSIVGMEMVMDEEGNFYLLVQYDDGTLGKEPVTPPNLPSSGGDGGGKRWMWRQLSVE